MPFDGFVLAAVCKELKEKITGCRIDRIYQPAPESILFNLFCLKERMRLFLSCHPVNARVHLTSLSRENPVSPPMFCMVLRKHLERGRIRKVFQPGLERILVFEIEARDELGTVSYKNLICEIMGKHSNIILVDTDKQIIDACKRYSHAVSRYREVLPGRPYLFPPEKDKLDPFLIKEEEFQQALLTQPFDMLLEEVLQRTLDGFSRVMAREVVYRAGLSQKMVLDECGEYELNKLWQALEQIIKKGFEPTLIFDNKGNPVEFSACNLTHLSYYNKKGGEMNSLIDKFFLIKETNEEREREKNSLLKAVRNEIKRLNKKLSLHYSELSNAGETGQYRLYGELLMANLHNLEKGLTEVTLENFYEPGNKVCISLDPQLSPIENANAYFKKYTKIKRTCQILVDLSQKIQQELDYLGGVEIALEMASTVEELNEIKEELKEQGYIGKRTESKKNKKETPKPLVFTSSDGFTILVGKNNKQNDYLTMRLAKDNDIWVHVKNFPGAHVVVRTGNRQITPVALREAACLAAYYSRARYSLNVPVDYTARKNVKKPRGAKPGFVTYTGQRTINVNPDEKLVENLVEKSLSG